MLNAQKLSDALQVADAFVSRKRRTDPTPWSAVHLTPITLKTAAVFWWYGSIPLVEVPLTNASGTQSNGYLLVSTDRELPPILEYSLDGLPLSRQILQQLTPALARSNLSVLFSRFVFITSTEIYVEVTDEKGGDLTAVAIPDLFTFKPAAGIAISVKANSIFPKAIVDAQWDNLTPGAPGDKPEVILQNAVPVRYQQNCDKYANLLECGIELKTTQTYCSPNAIAGCVPVAWAMLLSSWKRTGYWDSSKIWPGSNCWDIEWPSWGGWANPSKCDAVNATIWRLHTLMGTTSDGSTNNSNTIAGAAIFSEFGIAWKYAQAQNRPFEFAIGVIQAGQPLLWTANGIWDSTLKQLSNTPVPGGVGHGVVAYGYKKADRTLLVALGWGYSYANKYINYDQYRITNCLYLTALTMQSQSVEALSVD